MKTIQAKNIKSFFLAKIVILALLLGSFYSCEKDMADGIFQVSDELMIDEILEEKADMSMFLSIIDKSGLRGTVHAYGTYSLFAPTNDAVTAYLRTENTSIEAMTQEDALKLVKYHLVTDTLSTADFIDGRLSAVNFENRYLTTKTIADTELNLVYIEVDRKGRIVEKDLRGANGYVHIVDAVLTEPVMRISDIIDALDPIQYSLMKEVYERSNFGSVIDAEGSDVDTLGNRVWKTFFIQDNDGFASVGITNIEQLLDRLKEKTPAITNEDTLLYNYVAYHCVPRLMYVADLLMASDLETMVDKKTIRVQRDQDKVILNEFEINGELEPGIEVDRYNEEYADLSCANGVVHKIKGNIEIVNRAAYRIFWDIAEQPEIMALKGFRKAGTHATFVAGDLSEITWGGRSPQTLHYYCFDFPTVLSKDSPPYVYGDYLSIRICSNTTQWIEFKTPVLIEGQYKVWFTFRRVGNMDFRTVFKQEGQDDQILGNCSWNWLNSPASYGMTEWDAAYQKRLELDGMKVWTPKLNDTALPSVLHGIIDVQTTGRHILRLEPLVWVQHTPNIDMIHFIPLDEDQIWPKMDARGNWVYENTPDCEVWPYTDCNAGGEEGEGEEE